MGQLMDRMWKKRVERLAYASSRSLDLDTNTMSGICSDIDFATGRELEGDIA